MSRILVYGNSGTGKTTFARRKAEALKLAYLDLDNVAWASPAVRENEQTSLDAIKQFIFENSEWVIEGCYGKIIQALLEECTELHFMNPGIEVSLRNNSSRDWEPHKYASMAQQEAQFEKLQQWVAEYEKRDDEFSYEFHRMIFSGFGGKKFEYQTLPECDT
jgi:adenylate kinase family enzyme